MPKFRKKILREDRDYHSPDGTVSVDSGTKKHWADKVGSFLSKGFDIPVFYDHQDDPDKAKPVKRSGSKRRRVTDQAGWLTGAKVDTDGSIEIELDVPSRTDSQRLADNLAKVSPVIWDVLEDGEGEIHENVIGAMDLVVHPVDNTQTNFESAEPAEFVACSITRFSIDSPKPKIYRMADDMADEEDREDETETTEEVTEQPVADDTGERLNSVLDALAGLNVVLSDDTNEANFLEHLHQALLTLQASEGNSDMADETPDTGTEDLAAESPEFAALSLEKRKRQKLEHVFAKKHREDLKKRLSLLARSGRCTPAELKQWGPKVGKVQMSLDRDGNPSVSDVESFVASRESVPRGTFWDDKARTRMSNDLEVAKHPPHVTNGDVSDEDAEEIVKSVFARKQ